MIRAAFKRDKGVALLIVLILVIVLSLMGAVVLGLAGGHYGLTRHQIEHTQAFYLAEAGMVYAIYQTRNGSDPIGTFTLKDADGNDIGEAAITLPAAGQIKSEVTY